MPKPKFEASVDVTKLNKAWFFVKQNGAKMADFAYFDKPSKYSDGFVVQKPSRAAREAGEKGPIVGNWKYVEKPAPAPQQQRREYSLPKNTPDQRPAPRPPQDPDLDPAEDDDIPF